MTKNHIELRLKYPGHPRIACIDGLNQRQELSRQWSANYLLFVRRERKDDGKEEVVYHLPLIDAVYETGETIDGCRVVRYVATLKGSRTLYLLARHQVEDFAEGKTSIARLAGCPCLKSIEETICPSE